MSSYVIAGASRGIGLEFVRQLSSDASNTVVGLARNPKEAVARYGGDLPSNVTFVEADIVDHQSLKKAASEVDTIVQGKLDYLINNGAMISKISPFKSLADFPEDPDLLAEDLSSSFKTNVIGVIQTINAFVPLLRNGTAKKVLTLSTGFASTDFVNLVELDVAGPYAISKAAVNMAVAHYNAVYKKEGILFMAISPGYVDTGNTPDLSNEENLKGMMAMGAKFAGYAPHLKGAIQPDESVGLMLNLLNKASIEKGDGGSFISHLGNQQWL